MPSPSYEIPVAFNAATPSTHIYFYYKNCLTTSLREPLAFVCSWIGLQHGVNTESRDQRSTDGGEANVITKSTSIGTMPNRSSGRFSGTSSFVWHHPIRWTCGCESDGENGETQPRLDCCCGLSNIVRSGEHRHNAQGANEHQELLSRAYKSNGRQ
jgi:hypothetical protein